MATHATPSQAQRGQHHVGHVVPMSILIGVAASLMVLTVITVTVTTWDFGGRINLVVAMSIAVVKGSLVALYFMHLKWDKPFNGVIFVTSLALLGLFLGLAILDTVTYEPERIPGYAPEIEQAQTGS